MSNQPMTQPDKKKGLSKKFIWFHATSVNGTAMAIAATLATYFSLYVQEEIGITAAQLSVILLICSLWDAINDPLMGLSVTPAIPDGGVTVHGFCLPRFFCWWTCSSCSAIRDLFREALWQNAFMYA